MKSTPRIGYAYDYDKNLIKWMTIVNSNRYTTIDAYTGKTREYFGHLLVTFSHLKLVFMKSKNHKDDLNKILNICKKYTVPWTYIVSFQITKHL